MSIEAASSGTCSMRLCERCQGACFDDSLSGGFIATSKGGEATLHFPLDADSSNYETYAELFADFELLDELPELPVLSSSTECDFCCFLVSAILESAILESSKGHGPEIYISLSYCWGTDGPRSKITFGLCGLCVKIHCADDDRLLQTIRLTIDSDDEECKRWLRLQPTPSPDFLCQQNITKIKAKLDACPPMNSTFFPTRVIDLGTDPEGQELRLAAMHECLDPHYAALSYCWGSPEEAEGQFMTLRSNLPDRHSGFQLSEVSVVIKDAVAVCRALGMRYLWVDAVCIVQDDEYDWEQESALMAEIFRSAHFVIGAAASTSCNEGFLSFSRPFIHLPFESRLKPGLRGAYRLVLQRDDALDLLHKDCVFFWDLAIEDYMSSKWRTRGWVRQEIVAARNLLISGRTGLWPQLHGDPDVYNILDLNMEDISHRGWLRIVMAFSGSELTHETDRLAAISGLAQLYSSALQDEYLAGLWKRNLCCDILWSQCPPNCTIAELVAFLESPDPYIAPSWSWARQSQFVAEAASGMNIIDDWDLRRQEFTLLDAETELAGSNEFGQLASGQLTLRSRASGMSPYWCCFDDSEGLAKNMDFLTMELDWGVEESGMWDRLVVFLIQSCIEKRPPACTCDKLEAHSPVVATSPAHSEKEEDIATHLDVLNIQDQDGAGKQERGWSSGHEALCIHCEKELVMYGLLLRPAKEPGKFFRVGTFISDPNTHAFGGFELCKDWETRTVEII